MSKADQPRFIADTMLGSLARKLRLLGIDTAYISDAEDSELKYLVRSQGRILLTRDTDLSGSLGGNAWPVNGSNARQEFASIGEKLKPFNKLMKPFSRCLECNDLLVSIDPAEAKRKVPPYIYRSKKIFYRCPSCEKVFWEGTHCDGMRGEISWMKSVLGEGPRGKGEEGR